jgi:hypothetical protein
MVMILCTGRCTVLGIRECPPLIVKEICTDSCTKRTAVDGVILCTGCCTMLGIQECPPLIVKVICTDSCTKRTAVDGRILCTLYRLLYYAENARVAPRNCEDILHRQLYCIMGPECLITPLCSDCCTTHEY